MLHRLVFPTSYAGRCGIYGISGEHVPFAHIVRNCMKFGKPIANEKKSIAMRMRTISSDPLFIFPINRVSNHSEKNDRVKNTLLSHRIKISDGMIDHGRTLADKGGRAHFFRNIVGNGTTLVNKFYKFFITFLLNTNIILSSSKY